MNKRIALFLCLIAAVFTGGSEAAPVFGMRELAAHYGFPPPVEDSKKVTFKTDYTTMIFETGTRRLLYNDTLIYLNAPVIPAQGEWTVRDCDVNNVLNALLRRDSALADKGCRIVVLDPGHGGLDRGTVGRHGAEEAGIVLDIAHRVAERLEACGVQVRMTRERDRFIELPDRSRIAWEARADLFVSIHANSAADRTTSGIETFIPAAAGFPSTSSPDTKPADLAACPGNRFDQANTVLGYYLQKAVLVCAKAQDRGLKHARFMVLRDAPCPSALVECGFVSNRGEEDRLTRKEYRDRIAEGITRGILTYMHCVNEARYSQLSQR